MAALEQASVPSGRIYTVADIAADPHFAARGMLASVDLSDGTSMTVPGFVPKLSRTPGNHRRNAPALGQDTEAVLREVGVTPEQIDALRARGVIS
jgi:formyl-CoA transferase